MVEAKARRSTSKPLPIEAEPAEGQMPGLSKAEGYAARAAESLAAAGAATNARDRAFHERAHCVWRKLVANVAAAEERAASAPPRAASPPNGLRR